MEPLLSFKKTIISQILITAVIVSAAAVFLGFVPVAKGFALGSIFSLVNFLIMVQQAPKRLGKKTGRAGWENFMSLLFRMVILGLPIFLAIRFSAFNLIATVIGIFNLQFSIFLYGLFVERLVMNSEPNLQRR
ncbi:MAG: ATP synthase subunit I [Thermodesulfobacteriota bacterium]|nr:ATP synthase subunit I [Thermodesulfobacteriota bacterium]